MRVGCLVVIVLCLVFVSGSQASRWIYPPDGSDPYYCWDGDDCGHEDEGVGDKNQSVLQAQDDQKGLNCAQRRARRVAKRMKTWSEYWKYFGEHHVNAQPFHLQFWAMDDVYFAYLWNGEQLDQEIHLAAVEGDPWMQFWTGLQLAGERDYSGAVYWLRKAVEKGHVLAHMFLSAFLWGEFPGVVQDKQLALSLLEKAAEQGSTDAQIELGRVYAEGEFVSKDETLSLKWFERLRSGSNPVGWIRLARAYRSSGQEQKESEAAALCRKGMARLLAEAKQGDWASQAYLAQVYTYGWCGEKDYVEGYAWAKLAVKRPFFMFNRPPLPPGYEAIWSLIASEDQPKAEELAERYRMTYSLRVLSLPCF